MGRKAYLFDFDGTLIDTMGGFADIAGRVINRFHPEISYEQAREKYINTSGVPFFQQLEIIFPFDVSNAGMAEIFEHEKQSGFFSQSFSDDVRYTVNELRARGNIAGVCSNNFQELIDRFVDREKLEFDIVLGYRKNFQKGKDHFNYIMKKFSLKPYELVFVGDSLKDAEKAIVNKIKFIGKCGTFKKQDFHAIDNDLVTIDNLKELLEL